MDMTNPKREQTQRPVCPNCGTDLTGKTKNWGSRDEGDYIVYQCDTCAACGGSALDGMVYNPVWQAR